MPPSGQAPTSRDHLVIRQSAPQDHSNLYHAYWGKAAANDQSVHLLPYHSLDVAAVGQRLLTRHNVYREGLAKLCGLSTHDFSALAIFFLALHDLGKFARSFQQLRIEPHSVGQSTARPSTSQRHDYLGYRVWREHLSPRLQAACLLPPTRRRSGGSAVDLWVQAVTGHHGQPPIAKAGGFLLNDHFGPNDLAAAESFVADVRLLMGLENALPRLDKSTIARASWWLAGFAVLCDWLGSNREFFPFDDTPRSLADYWHLALNRAEIAIDGSELLPAAPAESLSLGQLLGQGIDVTATPLQALAAHLPLSTGPQLFVLEDVTGAGKTEAALLLAHRLMADGLANGLYIGLPTMATANAMYERVGTVYRAFYDAGDAPSLVLAHGARDLSARFRQSLLPIADASEAPYTQDSPPPASTHCGLWLADNRKKALLAEVGIGTIDQALLGILPSRHQALRLLGLMHKVLIVDEVHACDAYMLPLLERLLTAHAAAGGSAILLSATLPQRQRARLLAAFADGTGTGAPAMPATQIHYPMLTHLAGQTLTEHPVATRASVKRRMDVRFVSTVDAIHNAIATAVAAGQCACWIRNTVTDARTSYLTLKAQNPGWDIALFHARFALGDRLTIEGRALDDFGRDSGAAQRRGRVLIATQVVEQSLDLDFDCLITDLAPVELIIQRAGRLHRHTRDQQGNRTQQHDLRDTPELLIHAPLWQDTPDAGWFADHFPIAQYVYPNHGQLWRTMQLLRDAGGFSMPDDARALVEGVYDDQVETPEGLIAATLDAEGDNRARASQAFANALDLDAGYDAAEANVSHWASETKTPTRLGEETSTLWLARWDGRHLDPWRDAGSNPWHTSSLTVRSHLVASVITHGDIPAAEIARCVASLPGQGRWGVLVPLISEDNQQWHASAMDAQQKSRTLEYSPVTGLTSALTTTEGTE